MKTTDKKVLKNSALKILCIEDIMVCLQVFKTNCFYPHFSNLFKAEENK